jgi:TnpA family transposase
LAKSGSVASSSSNRAGGLNLLTAAIVLRNTVYLQRATDGLRKQSPLDEALLSQGRFRPLRLVNLAAQRTLNSVF